MPLWFIRNKFLLRDCVILIWSDCEGNLLFFGFGGLVWEMYEVLEVNPSFLSIELYRRDNIDESSLKFSNP